MLLLCTLVFVIFANYLSVISDVRCHS